MAYITVFHTKIILEIFQNLLEYRKKHTLDKHKTLTELLYLNNFRS